MIYKRFTEKSAEEWRQIYKVRFHTRYAAQESTDHKKALQLMEYLIKNGSERVIDDVRSHLSLLKMLKQFHFTDMNGKDQGINIRNRAKELVELLSDVDRIRAERKKARTTRNKYGGVEGGAGLGAGFLGGGGSSRYGGFGRDEASFGGYSGGVYGDGGGFGGNTSGFSDTQARRDRFDEYDEYDEAEVASPTRGKDPPPSSSTTTGRAAKKAEPPKPKEPEVDLFSFGDEEPASTTISHNQAASSSMNDFGSMNAPNAAGDDDDDFDDFQSAGPSISTPQKQSNGLGVVQQPATNAFSSIPPPISNTQLSGMGDLLSTGSSNNTGGNSAGLASFSSPGLNPMQQQQQQQQQPSLNSTGYQAAQPNYFTSVTTADKQKGQASGGSMAGLSSVSSAGGISNGSKPSGGGDAFSSLLEGTSIKKPVGSGQKGMTMADMAKQKATAGIWAASGQQNSSSMKPGQVGGNAGGGGGGALDDLLG